MSAALQRDMPGDPPPLWPAGIVSLLRLPRATNKVVACERLGVAVARRERDGRWAMLDVLHRWPGKVFASEHEARLTLALRWPSARWATFMRSRQTMRLLRMAARLCAHDEEMGV